MIYSTFPNQIEYPMKVSGRMLTMDIAATSNHRKENDSIMDGRLQHLKRETDEMDQEFQP
jgi:hypothetical protein